eukprot:m.718934 g.718934  ORF g.718934 m.718934 type:complete len:116 (+) comp58810_c0_seq7:3061-3408(+)
MVCYRFAPDRLGHTVYHLVPRLAQGVASFYCLGSLKAQCEVLLSEKISPATVTALFEVSLTLRAGRLLRNSVHFILMNYEEMSDENHELLRRIFENVTLEMVSLKDSFTGKVSLK